MNVVFPAKAVLKSTKVVYEVDEVDFAAKQVLLRYYPTFVVRHDIKEVEFVFAGMHNTDILAFLEALYPARPEVPAVVIDQPVEVQLQAFVKQFVAGSTKLQLLQRKVVQTNPLKIEANIIWTGTAEAVEQSVENANDAAVSHSLPCPYCWAFVESILPTGSADTISLIVKVKDSDIVPALSAQASISSSVNSNGSAI